MKENSEDNESVETGNVPAVNCETPGYMKTRWTNESYSIEWVNEDKVNIIDHNTQRSRVIAGGDLEHLLSCVFI